MIFVRAATAILVLLSVSGCVELRESQPDRTATEQLLFSTAADRVCEALSLRIPPDSRVYVDSRFVEGTDSKYLVATLRDRILRNGGNLVGSREEADLVFEPRVGAMSVDRETTLVGLPSFPVPIPLIGNVEFPELALFKRDRQQGVIKLALTSYDATTGALHQSIDPVYGFSQRTDWLVLVILGWQDNDLMPEPTDDRWVGESTFE
ncbi:MAG: hypothetical protein CMM50_14065 [Rhodospirillaceae bacterium]|jgi:hypothetical protein|nr:hypothetical protein [Rhodospirillaceae bacterium]